MPRDKRWVLSIILLDHSESFGIIFWISWHDHIKAYMHALHILTLCVSYIQHLLSSMKGCFYKNDIAYFGENGTAEEMSSASLGQKIRSKCIHTVCICLLCACA